MLGGSGTTKLAVGQVKTNRALHKKKVPFQRMRKNLFRKVRPNNLELDESTVNDLHQIKVDRRMRERSRKRFFVRFRLVVLMLIILVIWLSV